MDTLVLNADGAPVNFLPLSTINWQEAIRYMVLDKAHDALEQFCIVEMTVL